MLDLVFVLFNIQYHYSFTNLIFQFNQKNQLFFLGGHIIRCYLILRFLEDILFECGLTANLEQKNQKSCVCISEVNSRMEIVQANVTFTSFSHRQNYPNKLEQKLVRGAVFKKKLSYLPQFGRHLISPISVPSISSAKKAPSMQKEKQQAFHSKRATSTVGEGSQRSFGEVDVHPVILLLAPSWIENVLTKTCPQLSMEEVCQSKYCA